MQPTRTMMPQLNSSAAPKEALRRVRRELYAKGASLYNMWLPETHYLPLLLRQDESIKGSVFGRYPKNGVAAGRAALIATNQRILYLDKKPFYIHLDELTCDRISGITYSHTLLFSYVTLHSMIGDFKLRTFNQKGAAKFIDYIESNCLKIRIKRRGKDHDSST